GLPIRHPRGRRGCCARAAARWPRSWWRRRSRSRSIPCTATTMPWCAKAPTSSTISWCFGSPPASIPRTYGWRWSAASGCWGLPRNFPRSVLTLRCRSALTLRRAARSSRSTAAGCASGADAPPIAPPTRERADALSSKIRDVCPRTPADGQSPASPLSKLAMLRRLYDCCIAAADKPYATWLMGIVSFVESSFFPIPPDTMLIPMALARPDRAWFYATVCTLTSVAGGVLGYFIGAVLYDSIGLWLIQLYGYGEKVDAFRAA